MFLVCLISMLCFLCAVTVDQLNKIDDEVQRHLDDKLAILRTLQVWCMFLCVTDVCTCVVYCTCTVSTCTSLLRSALLQQYNYDTCTYQFLDYPNCAKRLHQYLLYTFSCAHVWLYGIGPLGIRQHRQAISRLLYLHVYM